MNTIIALGCWCTFLLRLLAPVEIPPSLADIQIGPDCKLPLNCHRLLTNRCAMLLIIYCRTPDVQTCVLCCAADFSVTRQINLPHYLSPRTTGT